VAPLLEAENGEAASAEVADAGEEN